MKLFRFRSSEGLSFGPLEGGWLYDISRGDVPGLTDLQSLYASAGKDVRSMAELIRAAMKKSPTTRYEEGRIEIPLQGVEIWAAGVTYLRSREARESETSSKGIYDRVYSAQRPELFLKDTGIRCRGPGMEVCVRGDSNWSVPEPELTVVFDEDARAVGYTIGNDLSSRDIEGENPLYLPQAKVYRGSSAIGPCVVTADEIPEPHSLLIKMKILREGTVSFEGSVNTSQMKRSIDELAGFLKRDNELRTFTLLMTGTSIVPPDDFTLKGGEVIEIEIEKIGTLRNPVVKLPQ